MVLCVQVVGHTGVMHNHAIRVMESWNSIINIRAKKSFKMKMWNSIFFVVIWTIGDERNMKKL